MKKVIVSLLVLAFMALAATGTVSAQCAAKVTTSTCAATTCAQCTSCVTSTCCSSCCPTTCCCPTVACCVVTQCCEVKAVWAMPVWKPVYKQCLAVVTPAAAVAAKGGAAASASGNSQAAASTQTIIQTNTQSVTGDNNTVRGLPFDDGAASAPIQTGTGQSNTAVNSNIVIKDIITSPAVAWGNATAIAKS